MAEPVVPGPATPGRRGFSVSRRNILVGAGGMAAGVALGGLSNVGRPAAVHADTSDDGDNAIVKFHTMAPVTGAFVGATGTPIRGIHGGGLPWALDAADGELSTDGRLLVRVRGLVLAAGPAIGTNPISTFSAIVSFEGMTPIVTDAVPASTTGDADIDTHVDLPHPGFAPIIFVGPGGRLAWFAVTGLM